MEQAQFVNEAPRRWSRNLAGCQSKFLPVAPGLRRAGDRKQPQPAALHRRRHMLPSRALILLGLMVLPWSLTAQSAVAAEPSSAAPIVLSNALRPALSRVNQVITGVNIRHWKAPNSVKSAADGDISSIQRDLSGTLAGLISQAEAAPNSVPSAFAVYRNVDALYDTLLRVVETADLSAPDEDVSALETSLRQLEEARADLGEKIMAATQAQQNELVRLRTIIVRAATTPSQPVKTIVVDDGPAKKEKKEEHHRHTTKKSTAKPADSNAKPTPQ